MRYLWSDVAGAIQELAESQILTSVIVYQLDFDLHGYRCLLLEPFVDLSIDGTPKKAAWSTPHVVIDEGDTPHPDVWFMFGAPSAAIVTASVLEKIAGDLGPLVEDLPLSSEKGEFHFLNVLMADCLDN